MNIDKFKKLIELTSDICEHNYSDEIDWAFKEAREEIKKYENVSEPSENTMGLYQQRVIEEKKALDIRISNLKAFLYNPFSKDIGEQFELLCAQLVIMERYSRILGNRISLIE